mmetsp:Transcript_39826/g.93466  ORF Transcript_39826/g.93466 Transcript_39826/m.93466 type:complete len:199 (-) Transcript_39826:857-1453(-)
MPSGHRVCSVRPSTCPHIPEACDTTATGGDGDRYCSFSDSAASISSSSSSLGGRRDPAGPPSATPRHVVSGPAFVHHRLVSEARHRAGDVPCRFRQQAAVNAVNPAKESMNALSQHLQLLIFLRLDTLNPFHLKLVEHADFVLLPPLQLLQQHRPLFLAFLTFFRDSLDYLSCRFTASNSCSSFKSPSMRIQYCSACV